MIRTIVFCAILSLSFTSQRLKASPITWQFAGHVTNVNDPEDLHFGHVDPGFLLLLDVTFDPLVPGERVFTNPITNVSGTLGDLDLRGPIGLSEPTTSWITAYNDLPYDAYGMSALVNLEGVTPTLQLSLFLEDEEGGLLNSETILTTPPSLPETAVFGLWLPDTKLAIEGTLTSISIVPEPCSALLIIFGSLVLMRKKFTISSG